MVKLSRRGSELVDVDIYSDVTNSFDNTNKTNWEKTRCTFLAQYNM